MAGVGPRAWPAAVVFERRRHAARSVRAIGPALCRTADLAAAPPHPDVPPHATALAWPARGGTSERSDHPSRRARDHPARLGAGQGARLLRPRASSFAALCIKIDRHALTRRTLGCADIARRHDENLLPR